jgi:hypothetical protein
MGVINGNDFAFRFRHEVITGGTPKEVWAERAVFSFAHHEVFFRVSHQEAATLPRRFHRRVYFDFFFDLRG